MPTRVAPKRHAAKRNVAITARDEVGETDLAWMKAARAMGLDDETRRGRGAGGDEHGQRLIIWLGTKQEPSPLFPTMMGVVALCGELFATDVL